MLGAVTVLSFYSLFRFNLFGPLQFAAMAVQPAAPTPMQP
jgi:hypothetical protein